MVLARTIAKGATAAAVLSTASLAMGQGTDRSGDPDIPREVTYPDPHYYVDPAGNDSASGKSEAEAWASLAPLKSVRTGTVYLKKGGTWQSNLSVGGITLSAYGTGSRPIINGSVSVTSKASLEGVKVDGKGRIGITISGSGNVVHDCEIDGRSGTFELGFGVMGTGNLIIGNSVHHLSAMSGDSGDMNTSGGSEAYMIMGSNNEIAYNSASEAHGINKTLGGEEGGCLEIVNGKAGSVIENVYFHHNYCERSIGLFEGCSGNFQGTDKIQENHGIIRNSHIAYNISVDAMWLYLLQPVNTDFDNLVFEHNTIVHTPANNADFKQAARNSLGLLVTEDQGYTAEPLKAGNVLIRNNLFYVLSGSGSGGGAMGGGFMGAVPASDHYNNLFAGVSPGWTLGTSELKVDDPGLTADYRLAAGSPAINAGSTKAWQTWTDFDGNAVPLGDAPDIGASEFCDGSDCKTPTKTETGSATGGDTGGSSAGGSTGAAGSSKATTSGGGGSKKPGTSNNGGAASSTGGGSSDSTANSNSGSQTEGGSNASQSSGGTAKPGSSGSGGATGDGSGDDDSDDDDNGQTQVGSTGGGGAKAIPADSGNQPGCHCRTAGRPSESRAGAFALLCVLGALVRRRGR